MGLPVDRHNNAGEWIKVSVTTMTDDHEISVQPIYMEQRSSMMKGEYNSEMPRKRADDFDTVSFCKGGSSTHARAR